MLLHKTEKQPPNPQHLILRFQLLRHALFFLHPLHNPIQYLMTFLINIVQIFIHFLISYTISTSSKKGLPKSLHHFYIILVYNVALNADTRLTTNEQDILCKSNSRTPCLILYVKVQKIYHPYTVPISYLHRFSDFYIISISLKTSVITNTISYLYQFSDLYTIAISKWTNVISILYH